MVVVAGDWRGHFALLVVLLLRPLQMLMMPFSSSSCQQRAQALGGDGLSVPEAGAGTLGTETQCG